MAAPDCDRIVSLEPFAPAAKPRDLAWLGEADRYLAEKLLGEPFMYVSHPLFEDSGAEDVLFGGPAVLASAQSTYFVETAATGPAETGTCLLNAADERLLFQRYNYARMRVARLLQAGRGRRIRRADLQLMLAWLHRALMIRGRLTQANIPLVLSMAKRPQFAGLDASEVLSAGNYALLRSIDRFDCAKGFKFSTYACQGILQRILHVVDATRRYRSRFVSDFDQNLEKDDTPARRHQAQEQDWIDELREILANNRAGLTQLERTVIRCRYGLQEGESECEAMTLKDVGALMGVTKERIRQVQKRALEKLRSAMERECVAA